MEYLTFILWLLFGISNGITEVLSFWYKQSVFQTWDPRKYNPNINWMYIKPFLNWMRFDLYHIIKMAGLACGILALADAFLLGYNYAMETYHIDVWKIVFMCIGWWACWFIGAESMFKLLKRPFMETPVQYQ